MDYLRANKNVDTERAWRNVRDRLQQDGLIPEQREIAEVSPLPRRLAYAAALLVLIAVGSLSYFLFSDLQSSRLMTLRTGADNSTLVQTFDDGSVVYVADNSVLNYPASFRGGQRKVSLSGEAFFDIKSRIDQPFVIGTNHAIIEVMGTAFNLKSYDNDFELIVEDGSVRVTLRDLPGHSEIVGQWEMLTGTVNRMEKSPVIDRTYLSWRMNRMQFRDEKLENIASVISRNYDVNIYFEHDAIRDRRLNVTFYDNDINIIAEVIAFGLGLNYEILPDSGIMFSDKY